MHMKPRECWSVLANKAEDIVALNQQAVKAAREHLEKLQASKERLVSMSNEYAQKIREKEQTTQSLIESNNARQFVLQLLHLRDRLDKDVDQARAQLDEALQALRHADQERLKMQTLVEQDLLAVKTYHRQLEQKQMDALGLTLFNMKSVAMNERA
ncbi:MAG: flagellar export protein FliJ [Burkholderiaceae bacterium]